MSATTMQEEPRKPHVIYDQSPDFFAGFGGWKAATDSALAAVCGMISDDLPDVDYFGLWKSGNTPNQAARFALEQADADSSLYEGLPE